MRSTMCAPLPPDRTCKSAVSDVTLNGSPAASSVEGPYGASSFGTFKIDHLGLGLASAPSATLCFTLGYGSACPTLER